MKASIVLAAISYLLAGTAVAEDWPHYRGPDYNGIAPGSTVSQGETFGFEIDWITTLGSGYSSVSVVGDSGVTLFSDGTSNVLLAFDSSTGEERWHLDIGPLYEGHSGSRDGPTSTPTVHGGMVYALDPHGRMVAATLQDGERLWAHRLGKDVRARVPHYGFSTSPIVMGDKVIVMTGDQEERAVTAFEAKTGKLLWHAGADTTTYQSPI
ncbi:MAG: PQQ-binding-like beta-propeller repeat protein, partial [bacterium]|nr:PQQ-binding-like beta-propeller repeat protein [bacterium]